LVTTRQQTNDRCPHRPAATAQNAQIGAATSLIALQPTSAQIGGIARFAGVERLITQRERNRWCPAVAAADPALLAADGEAGQAPPAPAALHARALRPRVEVLTDTC
jgi:hypothetical protein